MRCECVRGVYLCQCVWVPLSVCAACVPVSVCVGTAVSVCSVCTTVSVGVMAKSDGDNSLISELLKNFILLLLYSPVLYLIFNIRDVIILLQKLT